MADLQQQSDLEQARAKLDEVETRKVETESATAADRSGPSVGMAADDKKRYIRPVTKAPKKKSFGEKLKESLFGPDVKDGSIADHVFFDMFIPAAKRIAADMINSAVNMFFGLDPRTRTFSAGGTTNTHAGNASVYRDRNLSRIGGSGDRGRIAISDMEWDEATARDIYEQIMEILDRFPNITVAEVYSIMGKNQYIRSVDEQWGWTSPRGIDIYPLDVRGERWVVDMPRARQL